MSTDNPAQPVAWLCELAEEDGTTRYQFVRQDPEGLRWNDMGEPSPYKTTPLYAAAPQPAHEPVAITKIQPSFRWDGEAQVHVPQLLIELQSVPANSPCDAKGWADRDTLAKMLAAPTQAAPVYKDSTPHLNVGNSAFESWFQSQPFATQSGIKQISRDSYAAGMGDPLVCAKEQAAPVAELVEALRGMLNIVSDSRGVYGYHLNGDGAEWDEFDEVNAARAALARYEGAQGGGKCGDNVRGKLHP